MEESDGEARRETGFPADPLNMLHDVIGGVADAAANISKGVADIASSVFPGDGRRADDGESKPLHDDDGNPIAPEVILDDREIKEIKELSDRYEKLTSPGAFEKLGEGAASLLPQRIKDAAQQAAETLTEQELYEQMMRVVADGFGALERAAAAATVSEQQVLGAFESADNVKLSSLDEVCLLRGYDVARVANGQNISHTLAALVEGGATGVVGFAGIPFNVVLSTFLYYRAVQSIAMFYGYDVKGAPAELVIAGEVLSVAFAPSGSRLGGNVAMVGKVMALAEAAAVGQTVKKGWAAMAQRGGACLLIAQMRALAHASARKALAQTGRAGLEKSVFRNVLEQIGRRLPQKVVQRGVPIVGGVIGALFDAGQMQRVLSMADVFYHKRFLVEKELRVVGLISGVGLEEGLDCILTDVGA